MKKEVVFVGGIHGVGKTTFCQALAKIMEINHYSASELIKRYNSELTFEDKKIKDVQKNQNALIASIEKFIEYDSFILDWHFTLLNQSNHIIDVPLDTFGKLNIKKILLLVLNPELILKRLNSRSQNKITFELIEPLQKKEIKQAEYISKILNVELIKLNGIESTNEYLKKIKKEN